jgi:hypothetical protein
VYTNNAVDVVFSVRALGNRIRVPRTSGVPPEGDPSLSAPPGSRTPNLVSRCVGITVNSACGHIDPRYMSLPVDVYGHHRPRSHTAALVLSANLGTTGVRSVRCFFTRRSHTSHPPKSGRKPLTAPSIYVFCIWPLPVPFIMYVQRSKGISSLFHHVHIKK